MNKKFYHYFYPTKNYNECAYCGIGSFAHRHEEGKLPKDFGKIEEKPVMKNKDWEEEFDKWFGHGEKGHLHGLMAEDYYKEIKDFIQKEKSKSYTEGLEKGWDRGKSEGIEEGKAEGVREAVEKIELYFKPSEHGLKHEIEMGILPKDTTLVINKNVWNKMVKSLLTPPKRERGQDK